jgi:Rieske Fe-S protein
MEHSRRDFCTRAASLGALSAALATLLEGCGKNSPTSPTNASSLPVVAGTRGITGVTVAVGSGSPLASVGGAALVQASGAQFLVAQTAQNTFVALTAICTHEACTVSGVSGQMYVCPCHGSTYNFNGQVITGPAPRALATFATTFSNGVLTIAA